MIVIKQFLSWNLFLDLRTKRLIVDVIRAQPGETLSKILETPASELQVINFFSVCVASFWVPHRRGTLLSFLVPLLDPKREGAQPGNPRFLGPQKVRWEGSCPIWGCSSPALVSPSIDMAQQLRLHEGVSSLHCPQEANLQGLSSGI